MLRKAWRIIDGDIYLYKANTYLNFEMEQDFKDYDYSKSMIGTFDIDNKAQAKEIIKQDPKKYKNWVNILANNIENINFSKVPEYRANVMAYLLKSRCMMIQEF